MKEIFKNKKGSALVTVIIVIAYISILATTILYLSGVNYQMKSTDKKIKVSFYSGESYVDVIRADMVREVEKTIEDIYPIMMANAGSCGSDAALNVLFETSFYDQLEDNVNAYLADSACPLNDTTIYKGTVTAQMVDGHFELQGIDVEKLDANGCLSIIKTNIVIKMPDITKYTWPYQTAATSGFTTEDETRDYSINYFNYVYYTNWVKQ